MKNESINSKSKILNIVNNYFINRAPSKREFNILVKKFETIYDKAINYKINSHILPFRKNFKNSNKFFLETMKNPSEIFPIVLYQLKKNNVNKLLIKPNLVSVKPYPETSDLNLIYKIVMLIKSRLPKIQITIADGPSIFYDDKPIFENKILKKMKDNEVNIINVLKAKYLQYKTKGNILSYLNLPIFINDFDYLINFACFKEHNRAGYSSAKKNLMGLLPDFERLRLHKHPQGLQKTIDDLAYIINSSLTIIDGRKILIKAQQRLYGGKVMKGFGFIISNNLSQADLISFKLFKLFF